jgi:ABC-2 type transport system permease protein
MRSLFTVLKIEGMLMNNDLKIVWEVTKWEFNRFFKWMDLIKGLLFFMFFGLIGGVIGYWLASDTFTPPDIAVANYGLFDPSSFEHSDLNFIDHTATDPDTLGQKLTQGTISAILTIHSADDASIRVPSDRAWIFILEQFLNELRRDEKIAGSGVDPEWISALQAGIGLSREFDKAGTSAAADKIVAGIAIFLVLMAVFMGFAYQFTAITAEKQQRITEQVISAIRPQAWIDGKILGISGIGMIYILFYGSMGIAGAFLLMQFGIPIGSALTQINPVFLITFILIVLLGILMWNSFYAAIAATIDDPNTSQKTGWMTMPIYPVMLAFFVLINPDSVPITVLGIIPFTSYAVLPARMVMTHVAWWESVLAILLLMISVHLFRIAAGRIFSTAIMMVGKEPGLKEMLYWFRRV